MFHVKHSAYFCDMYFAVMIINYKKRSKVSRWIMNSIFQMFHVKHLKNNKLFINNAYNRNKALC